MTYAPTSPFRKRSRKRPGGPAPGEPSTRSIEIFAPNRDAADLLLLYAAPLFPAEIAAGSVWIVRLQVSPGAASMLKLLSLVQRWVESARLPWANMLYDGGSYLIRRSTAFAQFAAATQSTTHRSTEQVRSPGGWTSRLHDVPRALGGSSEARDGCS